MFISKGNLISRRAELYFLFPPPIHTVCLGWHPLSILMAEGLAKGHLERGRARVSLGHNGAVLLDDELVGG